jgi:hypothetical protein
VAQSVGPKFKPQYSKKEKKKKSLFTDRANLLFGDQSVFKRLHIKAEFEGKGNWNCPSDEGLITARKAPWRGMGFEVAERTCSPSGSKFC